MLLRADFLWKPTSEASRVHAAANTANSSAMRRPGQVVPRSRLVLNIVGIIGLGVKPRLPPTDPARFVDVMAGTT